MLAASVSFSDDPSTITQLWVTGQLSSADDVAMLQTVLGSVAPGSRISLDLSALTALSDLGVQSLRAMLASLRDVNDDLAVVVGRIELRARLVLADLDRVAPILHTREQASAVLLAA